MPPHAFAQGGGAPSLKAPRRVARRSLTPRERSRRPGFILVSRRCVIPVSHRFHSPVVLDGGEGFWQSVSSPVLFRNGNSGPRKGGPKPASKRTRMSTQVELQLPELLGTPRQLLNLKAARREVADRLLAVARGEQPLEHPQLPGELAAAFLRGYDDQESTQEAYARDLADWFVWLARARVTAFDATLRLERDARTGRC